MQNIIKRFFSQEQAYPNVSIMGLDGAGKTTLLYKLAIHVPQITSIVPTIGIYIETGNIYVPAPPSSWSGTLAGKGEDNRPLCFTARVADAGGCAKMYPLVRHFILKEDEVSALVWVIDASSSKLWLDDSLEQLGVLLHGDYGLLIPVLVLANKIDLLASRKLPDGELRSKFEVLLRGRKFAIFETNITAGDQHESGLAEAFAWLGDILTPSKAPSSPAATGSETEKQKNWKEATVEDVVSNMRSPEALAAKLDAWLERADKDTITSDEELLRRFYAFDLPSWDHYIHLWLAYILLMKYGRKEGKDKIFDGFKEYIDKNSKGVNGSKKFHLTMTYFWVQMVHLGIARGTSSTANADADTALAREAHSLRVKPQKGGTEKDEYQEPASDNGIVSSGFARFLMLNSYLVDALLWQDYYSKEVLTGREAKGGFVLPDIKKLPDVL